MKSFCGGVQGGQFFQKAPPLVAEGMGLKFFVFFIKIL